MRGKDHAERLERIVDVVRRYAGNPDINVDRPTYTAELKIADHNRVLAGS